MEHPQQAAKDTERSARYEGMSRRISEVLCMLHLPQLTSSDDKSRAQQLDQHKNQSSNFLYLLRIFFHFLICVFAVLF